ncbi:MAG: hypothetical protein Kow0090_16990 [Myxococcota bacterium]
MLYSINLTGFTLEDDEGAYLYASWRAAEGESLYSEIPVAQSPALFWFGAFIFKVAPPIFLAARAASVIAALLSLLFMFLWAKKLLPSIYAAAAALLLTLNPIFFTMARFFRPEIFMLALMLAALFLYEKADDPENSKHSLKWLVASSALFAFSALFKPISALIPAAIILYRAFNRRWKESLALLLPSALIGAVAFGYLLAASPDALSLTAGQHLSYYKERTLIEHMLATFRFFGRVLSLEWPLWLPAIAGAILWDRKNGGRGKNRRLMLIAFIVTPVFFFAVKRELYPRHLFYLAPILSILAVRFAILLQPAGAREMGRVISIAVLALIISANPPPVGLWKLKENETACLASLVTAKTSPSERVFADYAQINFAAKRRGIRATPYLSQGAIVSGKLTSQTILEEIGENKPILVLIHESGGVKAPYGSEIYTFEPSHLYSLSDFELFKERLREKYPREELITCDKRTYRVFSALK